MWMLLPLLLLFFAVPVLLGIVPGIDGREAQRYIVQVVAVGAILGGCTWMFLALRGQPPVAGVLRFAAAGVSIGLVTGLLILIINRLWSGSGK